MAERTNISWCNHTINWWLGCTKVSPACDGCYAEHLMATRLDRVEWGAPGKGNGTRARTSPSTWNDPIRWNRKAEAAGTRPFVFSSSLSDIFDKVVPREWRRDAFDVMRRTPRLVYLLLTKRPQLIERLAEEAGGLPPNAAIGTTVEDQTRVEINIPALLHAAAALQPLFTFASCEPLLGPIDLTRIARFPGTSTTREYLNALTGHFWTDLGDGRRDGSWRYGDGRPPLPCLGWAIGGGETDQGKHKARPMHPRWAQSLRDQCRTAGVPFHFKQWGEWHPEPLVGAANGCFVGDTFSTEIPWNPGGLDARCMARVGKRRAGRLLDGREHNEMPALPQDRAA